MHRAPRRAPLLLSAAALLTLALPAGADTAPAAARLAAAVERKHALRSELRQQDARQHSELAELDSALEAAREKIASLEARLRATKEEAKRETQRDLDGAPGGEPRSAAELGGASLRSAFEAHRGDARLALETLRARVMDGIPYRHDDRLAEVNAALATLDAASLADQIEGVTQCWTVLGNELRLGRSVELYNAPVTLEGGKRKIDAYRIRVGTVFLGFAAEDGSEVGVHGPSGWTTELSAQQRQAIVRNINVLRRREPPALAPLPFWVAPLPVAKEGAPR